ncbi:MarR family transcriptional regulator [Clostridium sp. SYSU_GA19001]|uniref:MarR family winged helix-turn-helix transcriptional regulator n=1 Tax=Clostridium caldaquaticum TaxID=2940653 RepID=UPI0020774D83|nr:MarR family transcriptional regulator [Clostridium caldaquaticum]MCM8712096.1 MarR family transcriptional regulator [Clostridium caldaquaticum]
MNCHNPDSLYYAFSQVIRLHYHRIHVLLDEIGIYPGQPPLLMALGHNNGQTQRELADKLKIKPATITVMINRMEKSGLVERRQDTEDQRKSRVYLTEKGREVGLKVKDSINTINDEVFTNFTEEEKVLIRRFFLQMIDNLNKAMDKKTD